MEKSETRKRFELPVAGPALGAERHPGLGRHERLVESEVSGRSYRAALALADAAADRGLLDVAYGFADSPFGRLLVALTKRGVVRVAYPDHQVDEELQELSAAVSPRILESRTATSEVRRELEEYFEGKRRGFSVPVDLTTTHGFTRRVLEQTARIPFGSVVTYRDVAGRAGSPKGMRAAGNALGSNPIPIVVPCHRVVRSGGGLGGYTGGLDRKVALLALEGIDLPRTTRPARGRG